MRAILINPATQTIEEVDHSGAAPDIRATLTPPSNFFTVSVLHGLDAVLYVDDEGWLYEDNVIAERGYFFFGGTAYAGPALLIGDDGKGESVDAKVPLAFVQKHVKWGAPDAAGAVKSRVLGECKFYEL